MMHGGCIPTRRALGRVVPGLGPGSANTANRSDLSRYGHCTGTEKEDCLPERRRRVFFSKAGDNPDGRPQAVQRLAEIGSFAPISAVPAIPCCTKPRG